MITNQMIEAGAKALPKRCCGRCASWERGNPDDMTAPEGTCGRETNPGHWPTGYWPATLQRDICPEFQPAVLTAALQAETGEL